MDISLKRDVLGGVTRGAGIKNWREAEFENTASRRYLETPAICEH
jgi:hypothetical protein